MINKKKALAVAVAAVLTAPMAAYAVKYSLSGQTTQALYLIDTGKQSDYQFGGGGFTYSRLELKGNQEIDNGMKVGFHWEVQHFSDFPQFKGDGGGNTSPGIRHMNMSLGGGFGKLTLGQASQANDNAAFGDLGGASWMAFEASCDHATNTTFRTPDGGEDLGSTPTTDVDAKVTIANSCPSYDGSRDNGLRYDSPGGTPVDFAFSVHNEDKWTALIKAGGDAPGGMTWGARFGYADNGDASSYWAASGGIKFPSGTSINLMHGQNDRGTGKETTGWVVKLAHDVAPGTTFTLGARAHKDIWVKDNTAACIGGYCKSSSYGIGGTHAFGDSGATLVVGFQRHSLDDTTTAVEDINLFYVATRVRFN